MTYAYNTHGAPAVGGGLPGLPQRSASNSSRTSGDFYSRVEAADPQALADGRQLLFNKVYNRADYPGVEALFAKGNPRLAFRSPEPFTFVAGANNAVVSPDGSKFVTFSNTSGVYVYATGTRTYLASGTTQQPTLWGGTDSIFWVDSSTFYVATRTSGSGSASFDVFRMPLSGSTLVKTSAITVSNNWIMNCQAVYEDEGSLVVGWSNNNYGAGKVTINKSTGVATALGFGQGAPNLKQILSFKRNGRPVKGVETYLEAKADGLNRSLIQVRNVATGAITTVYTDISDNLVLQTQQGYSYNSDGYAYVGEQLKPVARFSPDGSYTIVGTAPSYTIFPFGAITAVDDMRRVILTGSGAVYTYDADSTTFTLLLEVPTVNTAQRPIGISPYTHSDSVIDYAIGATTDGTRPAVAYSGASKFLVDLPPDHRTGFRV